MLDCLLENGANMRIDRIGLPCWLDVEEKEQAESLLDIGFKLVDVADRSWAEDMESVGDWVLSLTDVEGEPYMNAIEAESRYYFLSVEIEILATCKNAHFLYCVSEDFEDFEEAHAEWEVAKKHFSKAVDTLKRVIAKQQEIRKAMFQQLNLI